MALPVQLEVNMGKVLNISETPRVGMIQELVVAFSDRAYLQSMRNMAIFAIFCGFVATTMPDHVSIMKMLLVCLTGEAMIASAYMDSIPESNNPSGGHRSRKHRARAFVPRLEF